MISNSARTPPPASRTLLRALWERFPSPATPGNLATTGTDRSFSTWARKEASRPAANAAVRASHRSLLVLGTALVEVRIGSTGRVPGIDTVATDEGGTGAGLAGG